MKSSEGVILSKLGQRQIRLDHGYSISDVTGDILNHVLRLAGIGATKGIAGNTTGAGMNTISYNSEGV